MKRASHSYGFGLSSLLHLGLVVALLWTWQQRPDDIALPGQTVPVTLSMFAEPVPAAVLQEQPMAVAESPPEAMVAPVPETEPMTMPEPVRLPAPVVRPAAKPQRSPRPNPVHPDTKPMARLMQTPHKPDVMAQATTLELPVVRPSPPDSSSETVARAVQQTRLRARYKAALLEAIERHKFYPKRARRRGIEGEVRLAFAIETDGRLSDVRILDSSASRLLDEAALSALRRLSRVDPLPAMLGMSRWELTVPMVFRIH